MLSKNPFIFKYNPEYIKDNQNQFIEGNYIKMTIRISLYSHIGECSDSDNEESEKQYIEEVYFNIPDYFTNEHGELLQKYYTFTLGVFLNDFPYFRIAFLAIFKP